MAGSPSTPVLRSSVPGATFSLTILTLINGLNYVDRYVPSAIKDLFQKDLNLSDTETAFPITAFVLVYMFTSPIFGYLSDRGYSRKRLLCGGVLLWSLATAGAALALNFSTFLIARALVGVGEAAYATIAPSLLSDYYDASQRSRILAIFYLAIPIGASLGYAVGGVVGNLAGWRWAFVVCGLPGVLLAFLCLMIQEPPRGAQDSDQPSVDHVSWRETIRMLLSNNYYLVTVGGMTWIVFASGGTADWFPSYMDRELGTSVSTSGLVIGVITVVGGIAGTSLGGYLGDKVRGKTKNPYLAVSALGMVITTVTAFLILLMPINLYVVTVLLVICQLFLWMYVGPCNALLANCVSPQIRTRAFAISIFLSHALGDAISPAIVGRISDATKSLWSAMLILPLAFLLGTVIWLCGWRLLDPLPSDILPQGRVSGGTGLDEVGLTPLGPSNGTIERAIEGGDGKELGRSVGRLGSDIVGYDRLLDRTDRTP